MNTPWGDFDVCDAHAHFFSRRFFDSLAAQARSDSATIAERLGWRLPPEDPAELGRTWAAQLDAHGVSQATLIASVPGDESSVLAAAAASPGRFFAGAMVDPTASNATLTPGLKLVCLFPAMQRYSLHDTRVGQLLDQVAAQHCGVFVHCGVLTVGVRKKLGLPSLFDMRFSNPLDLHAIALRYPQVRFIVPHFGAGFFREALMLADLCPNVYLDTSSSNSWMRYEELDLKTVFQRALAVAGAGRLLFGSDSSFFPRGWNRDVFEAQVNTLRDLGVNAGDAQRILGGNLRQFFSEN